MNIQELKETAQTGDIIAAVSSLVVRAFTWESFSHIAVILKENNEIFIIETHENSNSTTKILFDDWIKNYDDIHLGIAPKLVADNRDLVTVYIYDYLNRKPKYLKYGYWSLPLVVLNQIWPGRKFKTKLNVCSTLAQEFWNCTGWKLGKLMDPGDAALSCPVLYKINQ